MRRLILIAAIVLALGACSEAATSTVATSAEFVTALQEAGLEAVNPTEMGPDDYGLGPYVCDGTRFFIPSLGEGYGGRAFVCDDGGDLEKLRDYYDELGESSAMFFSWTFANGPLLIQINGDLPEDQAREFEAALANL